MNVDKEDMNNEPSRLLSLSGSSGVWAGCVALAGALIAQNWISQIQQQHEDVDYYGYFSATVLKFTFLAAIILLSALGGGIYFTGKQSKQPGRFAFNKKTFLLIGQLAIPLITGGIFVIAFLMHGNPEYVGATCLTFYGLSLINVSKYSQSNIHALGLMEIGLGCISIFFPPGYGLYFWAGGFGVLHILYGLVWSRKKDNDEQPAAQ